MIRLENITKTYVNAGKKFNAADNVTLEIKDGEIFGIIGFSGAGKSTLVRCINLLERPDSGKVLINGRDITALRGAELRRQRKKIGIVCNLAPRPMLKGKYVSEGMIFAADTADGGCSIAFYGDNTPVGSRIH